MPRFQCDPLEEPLIEPEMEYYRTRAGNGTKHRTPSTSRVEPRQYRTAPSGPPASQGSPVGIRIINKNTRGKFELENIALSTTLPPDVLGSPTSATRPSSSGSQSSLRSLRSLRQGNFREFLRRSSHEVKRGFEIVKMNDEERCKYYAAKKMAIEREVEEQRRGNLNIHPNSHSGGSRQNTRGTEDAYSFDALLKRLSQRRAPAEVDTGKSDQPQGGTSRVQARIGQGERAAVLVSRAFDMVKKQRRDDTNDSSMDFADSAPTIEMEACVRCKRPTTKFLTDGWCRECLQWYRGSAGRF